ncbi:LysR family transcriptional regulator [Oleispirillum naphthae]|uniref:LysR family transcriptional regulator n=1 Tax=Oleispirillum naphthae TaxID=2838853 RepID=UPI00308262FB
MNLRELEVFRKVMELGSVTAAAAALRISQPAVSKMLQQAEEQLGLQLFIRQKKRLFPTAEAQALFPKTVSAFAAVDVVRHLAADLRAGRIGQITLAVTPTLAHSIIPLAIRQFRRDHPEVIINLRSETAQEVARLVVDSHVDFGLIIGHVGDSRLIIRELPAIDTGCVLPPGHPLCAREEITVQDLADEPLITIRRHLPVGSLVSRIFEDANLPLRVAVEAPQSAIASALAHAGLGIAVLDGFAVLAASQLGMETRPFVPRFPMAARLIRMRQRPLSNLAESFIEVLDSLQIDRFQAART